MAEPVVKKNETQNKAEKHKLLKRIFRQFMIYLISLMILVGTIAYGGITLYNKILKPVDPDDTEMIKVDVPMGTSVSGIADILYDEGLIRNKFAFKILVDFSDRANRMQAGVYELSKSMTMQEMMEELLRGRVVKTTKRVTIREGSTISEIAEALVSTHGFSFTKDQFIEATQKIEEYEDRYPFLKSIPEERREQEFPMEGYLFPDTYFFYDDATVEQIITRLLDEFSSRIYTEENILRAEQLGISIDEAVVLASIVQKEGVVEEFTKISAVFHNRLKAGMKLESCATVNYFLEREVNSLTITNEDTRIDNPYNTYIYDMPVGPISTFRQDAFEAVLNPYEEFMEQDNEMLFFVLKDPEKGLHAFNSNYSDHLNDTNKYRELWKDNN